jgi:hypothetical protein
MKIKLEMSRERALLLSKACEVIARIGMCQFKDMVELLINDYDYKFADEIENYLKTKIKPELSRHAYNSILSNKVPEEYQVAWELYQTIRREIAWFDKGMDWRSDQRDWNSMMGIKYDDPMKITKLKDSFSIERIDDTKKGA